MKVLFKGQIVAKFQRETPVAWTPAFQKMYEEFQEKGIPVMTAPEEPAPEGVLADAVEYRKELGVLLNALEGVGYEIVYEPGEE